MGGEYAESLEKYLADQFPARNTWVTVKTLTDLAVGRREALAKFAKQMEEKRIPTWTMLVPTTGTVLADKLPAFAPYADEQKVVDLARSLGLNVVDLAQALGDHRGEYIYYRTDHHWTSLGAYYAYVAWMRARGSAPEDIGAWTKEELCDNFRGTTYAKVNYPFTPYDTMDAYYKHVTHTVIYNAGASTSDSVYEKKYLQGADQYAVFFNSNQAETVVKGEGQGKLPTRKPW